MSSANSFGHIFKITSFGESHGAALGVVIEGCPAGLEFDEDLLLHWMKRRRPGYSKLVSPRKEKDHPEILSGIFEGKTLGTPIAVIVRNEDAYSKDYDQIKNKPRIGHGDDLWQDKFGHRDHRGGGRSSGRETVSRVIGGAFAQMFLRKLSPETQIHSFVQRIADSVFEYGEDSSEEIESLLQKARQEGQSYGGTAELRILSPQRGLGQPVFRKIKSDLTSAMLSLGATCGVEFGEGFLSSQFKGTEFHDQMESHYYGGIRGGISTGETINLRVAFKPTSSIKDIAQKGRHDPCIVLRALPVIEAMAYLVLADHCLWSQLDRMDSLRL